MVRKFKPLPSAEALREYLGYNPRTGALFWIKAKAPIYIGKTIDCVGNSGYFMMGFESSIYVAHRIIYKLVTGQDPGEYEVDHRNLNKLDNRWKNLRLASSSQNMHNLKLLKRNKSGFKGVCWSKRERLWRGYATIGYKQYSAGFYKTVEEAAKAVSLLRKKLHKQFTNHG